MTNQSLSLGDLEHASPFASRHIGTTDDQQRPQRERAEIESHVDFAVRPTAQAGLSRRELFGRFCDRAARA